MIRLSHIATKFGVGALLVAVFSAVSLLTWTQQVNADQCSINGRDCYIGYFFGGYDGGPAATGTRHNVISNPALLNVNNAPQLIDNIRSHMSCSGGTLLNPNSQNATGSAFIILTMMGYDPGTSKNVACQVFSQWAQRVTEWAPYTNYNNFYNFGGLNTRSTITDVAYYPSAQTSAWSIVFYDKVTGQPLYAIKKDCANPVGRLRELPDTPYTLTPHVNTISPTTIEAGSKVTVTTSVDNQGGRPSATTQWEITQITVKPGKKAPHEDENGTASGTAPCQSNGGAPSGNYFQSGDADCKNVAKGSGVFNLGQPAQNLKPTTPDGGVDVGDLPVGTRVCFALSVQPRSNSDGSWAHSKPLCTVVGKKPKVQVWGGDLIARGEVETSTSTKDVSGIKTFGSWVEYGAFSVGQNQGFASGAGLNNGRDLDQQEAWSKLTFANVNNAGDPTFGNYSTSNGLGGAPGVAAFFDSFQSKTPVSGSVDLAGLTFNTGDPIEVRKTPGAATNLTITGGAIAPGKSVVIYATGTVTITGNITYSDAALSKLKDIPQVVIIAQNINIQDNVGRVDAWLVAEQTINTCHNFTGNLTSNKCNNLLEVNGPVVTNRLLLNRTAGSDTGPESGDPAERFNLRSDAFLWAQLQAVGNNKAQTVYSTELPPRF